MDEGGSLENCSPEELGPWVRILLPPPIITGNDWIGRACARSFHLLSSGLMVQGFRAMRWSEI